MNDYLCPDRITFSAQTIPVKTILILHYLVPILMKKHHTYIMSLDDVPPSQMQLSNPLYGYKITDIKSSSSFTELLIVKNSVYNKYVGSKSVFSDLQEKSVRLLLEKELGIEEASSRDKASLLSKF
jgi:hypothetical protein